MSLESWKAEFYLQAADVKFFNAHTIWEGSELEAVEHSLKKWRGLLKENLEKHQVYYKRAPHGYLGKELVPTATNVNLDYFSNRIFVDSSSCSLCHLYNLDCKACVFTTKLGQPCKELYDNWHDGRDAAPMVAALENIHKILTEGLTVRRGDLQ